MTEESRNSPAGEPKRHDCLCRDCHRWIIAPDAHRISRCPHCLSRRILQHAELSTLSISHLDCDAFFASIEKRDDPTLADKPLIIGGGKRGVVSTCCYIARTYGVRSAMPMFKALQACPHAVVMKPNGEKIKEASQAVRMEMEALTPLVQPLSSDEAFMDLTGTEKLHGSVPAITLSKLMSRIEDKIGITVSVGLSHNKFLAKIASDLDKPRGFAVIGEQETIPFLADKPISLIWGVGKQFSARLAKDGFHLIGDLQQAELKDLVTRYGEIGLRLSQLSRGEDKRLVNPNREIKSVSSETTFREDIGDRSELEDILFELSEKVSLRMKEKELIGRVVTVKLKTSGFKTITKRKTLDFHSNLARVIFDAGKDLLRSAVPGRAGGDVYRLIGIGISDLLTHDSIGQSSMFMDNMDRLAAQEKAVDEIRKKFGENVISSGRLYKNPRTD